jgi:recombination protein RecA
MASPLLPIDAAHSFPWDSKPQLELKSAVLLQQLSKQSPLAGITAASRLEVRSAPETASSGIVPIDALTGGLPRGCLTEICGPESSGHTTVMLAALAAATRRTEICALIDASDSFDPLSAAAAGLDLERLLWVRCGSPSRAMSRKRRPATSLEEWQRHRMEDPLEQALRAADLLLQSRGFGMVALDLAGVPAKMARRIPLTTWFRFRRAVENTPTILLVIGLQFCAESCASLAMQLGNSRQSPVVNRQQGVLSSGFSVLRENSSPDRQDSPAAPLRTENWELRTAVPLSHAELLTGIDIQAEVRRSCRERKSVQSVSAFPTKTAWTA